MTREKEIYKVTLVGSAGNLALLIFKFVAGVLGHSAAMVADAVHSLSDFFTDIIVLLFVKVSARPQDEGHDYGHGKFETLATSFIGMALAAVACGIVYKACVALHAWVNGADLPAPGMLALWAALVSILLKELAYRYTIRQSRKLNSPALEANAWHHRSDAFSSIGTLVGIGGAILLGQRWTVLDPLASLVVAVFLFRTAWKLLKPSFGELMEASLPDEVEKEILQIVTSFPDVSDPHNLRTRRIGNRIAIEVHVRMRGDMSLREAHDIVTAIEHQIKARFGPATLVTIHMEPK